MSLLDKIRELAFELSARHKYIHGDKGVLKNSYSKLKNSRPDTTMGKVGRLAGLGTIDLSWFLFCLGKFGVKDTKNALNTIFLDNSLIDKWKSKKSKMQIDQKDSDFKKFFKKLQKTNPKLSATLQLWMVYVLIGLSVAGGVKLVQHKDDIKDKLKELFSKHEKKSRKEIYNPSDANFTKEFIEDNFKEIIIGLLEFETYREKPVLQQGEKRYTYGPGLTWVYIDGKQYPCAGKHKKMAESFSDREIYNQVKAHCLYKTECLPLMRRRLIANGVEEISRQQILGLLLACYQLPSSVKDIIPRLQAAGNDEQKIIDAFIAGNEVKDKWREGTNKRRWWCAMLYTGKISIEDFLSMDRDAFSKVDINKIIKKGHFVFDEETIQYGLQRKKPSLGSVQDFIISKQIFEIEDTISDEQKSKTIVFNDAVLKIKAKQTLQKKLSNIKNNDEYTA